MNTTTATPFCQCTNCPGASCRCGCQHGQASSPAAAAPCACGPQCACSAAGQACACKPLQN